MLWPFGVPQLIAPEEAVQRKAKIAVVPRMLIKRFGSKLEKNSWASGEENEMKGEVSTKA